ncbi:uncharacterized protein TNCV_4271761 [Trichonephila clavipes]|nr:uncharacterized protein TNCV_4271761 [Trichonephila clavipes]
MSSGCSLPQFNLGVDGEIQRDSHNGAQRSINPDLRVGSSFRIHKNLKLEIAEERLLVYIISRLEPQLSDYVEVRQPQTTSSLLQLIDKYEERFLNRMSRGPGQVF